MSKSKLFLIFLLVFLMFNQLYSDDSKSESNQNWGFVFNTSNILFDLESYQAGLGAKLLFDNDLALRLFFDGFYSSSADTISGAIGATFEKHFRRNRVSPYFGGFTGVGIMRQRNEVDADNWTKIITLPISAGALLGVEFFVVENISFFAEYALNFESYITTSSTSLSGVVTKTDPEFSFTIDTGIGNESKLGICIYLDDVIKIERNNQ